MQNSSNKSKQTKESDVKIRVGIIGASGYTGLELLRILSYHPFVQEVVLQSESAKGKKVSDLAPDLLKSRFANVCFTEVALDSINRANLDVVFLAVPHGTAMQLVPKIKTKVIDLSSDYRFKRPAEFERVYGQKHTDKKRKAVYGIPELFKKEIKHAHLVANPGCYATGMILTAYPLQKLAKTFIFDGKSGWSGAGKSSIYATDQSYIQDNIVAYHLVRHRHSFEVGQFLKVPFSFTPHVINTFQGMMITTHLFLKKKQDAKKVKVLLKQYYTGSPFVQIVDTIPNLHSVQKTNLVQIGGFEVDEHKRMVIVTVFDNLRKGASGQAVQNMNLMFGFDERRGLYPKS